MVLTLVAILLPVVAGNLVLSDSRLHANCSEWFRISLGACLGLGLTSCLFFVWLALGGAPGRGYAVVESILLVVLICGFIQRSRVSWSSCFTEGIPCSIVLTGLACVAIISFVALSMTSPHGEWDGWAVWNMRARFLYRGGLSLENALRGAPVWTHPDYPLLLPACVARVWSYSGRETLFAPVLLAGVFAACTVGLIGASVVKMMGPIMGFLAAMIIMGAEYFVRHAAMQYADVPLGCFMLAAVVLVCGPTTVNSTRLVLAGVAAGMAAWTKNEGAIFCLALVMAFLIRPGVGVGRIRGLGLIILGMSPILAVLAVFKMGFAASNDLLSAMEFRSLTARLIDMGRWASVLGFFARTMVSFGGSVFPLLIAALLLLGRNRDAALARSIGFCWIVIALIMAADMLIYVVTPQDLEWHLKTSGRRLVLQVFPVIVFAFFISAKSEGVTLPQTAQTAR